MEKTKEQTADGTSKEQDNKKSHLIEQTQVEGTPFVILKKEKEESEEHEYYVLIGNVRLNKEPYETEEECKKWIKEITWDKILMLIAITIEQIKTIRK